MSRFDKRREFRFQLQGRFDDCKFAVGTQNIAAEPIDISRSGLGLILDTQVDEQTPVDLMIHFQDDRPAVTLHLRFRCAEPEPSTLKTRTRCGLELSEKDKRRGIDLIGLLSSNPGLRLLCAS